MMVLRAKMHTQMLKFKHKIKHCQSYIKLFNKCLTHKKVLRRFNLFNLSAFYTVTNIPLINSIFFKIIKCSILKKKTY